MKKINWTAVLTNTIVLAATGWHIYQAVKGSPTAEAAIGNAIDQAGTIFQGPKA